jgi:hypothetical protein
MELNLTGNLRPISVRDSDHLRDDDIVVMEAESGFVRSPYRPHERHHSLFVTERCSSNCLMCSQPPKDKDDVASLAERNLELIRLMDPCGLPGDAVTSWATGGDAIDLVLASPESALSSPASGLAL